MEFVVELKNVKKYFNDIKAVDGLSFSIPKNTCFGLLGPNGSGKTTTLRMILGIFMPDSGEIKRGFKTAGYLPEERGLYPKMKVYEIINFFSMMFDEPRKVRSNAEKWLEIMELKEYEKMAVKELSKGLAQRLQLVVTLMHDPDFIILDEPFSGLDPLSVVRLREIINDLRREKTILISTHWMDQAEKLCDEICLINKGKAVLKGKLKEIKRNYRTNKIYVELENEIDFSNFNFINSYQKRNSGYLIDINENFNINDVLLKLAKNNSLRKFEVVEPSLEEIFIKCVS